MAEQTKIRTSIFSTFTSPIYFKFTREVKKINENIELKNHHINPKTIAVINPINPP